MENSNDERIVMTPTKKERNHTVLRMERVLINDMESNVNDTELHYAGGNHHGIVINKKVDENGLTSVEPQLCLSFKVFLINAATQMHTQENRQLRFWFKACTVELEQMHTAQEFFRDLVNPSDFPRDYVGFIMKIMKLMQKKYPMIKQMEVEMKHIEEMAEPPSRPIAPNSILINVGIDSDCHNGGNDHPKAIPLPDIVQQCKPIYERIAESGNHIQTDITTETASVDDSLLNAKSEISEKKVLDMIESEYPNPISITEIANSTVSSIEEVHFFIQELESKNLIKSLDNGMYTRVTQNDTEVKLVRQMPKVVRSEQPTIAIITAQYCEKLAVDAMIDNKDTYVRYKTEGESNVYTLGNIGPHRVVSTKLPSVGHSRGAMIAAGNTTTRLLGTFQRVEHVFLIGVGGGVPHYTDFTRHVRLGDIVVSVSPNESESSRKKYIYVHCEKIKNSPEERANSPRMNGAATSVDSFNYRFWCPPDLELQEIARDIWNKGVSDAKCRHWEQYVQEGIDILEGQESEFGRPSAQTDKLYMSIGTKDVIEMDHPLAPSGVYDPRVDGMSMVHFGAIGSGRMAVRDEQIRQDIASKFGIFAFDTEFDSVVESVYGNRKDRYIFIRGIADYKDGTRRKEWQPYAALTAAAFMKAIICALPIEEEEK